MNEGKYLANSWGSISSWMPELLTWMCFVRLTTKLRFWSAFSSIEPTELYMKYEERRIARENILTSWFESSSKAPSPSVSIIRTWMGSPSGVYP